MGASAGGGGGFGGGFGGAGGFGGTGGGGLGGSGGFGGVGSGGNAGGDGGAGGEGGGGVITLDDPCGGFPAPDVLVDVGYQWSIPSFSASRPTIMIEGDRILAGGILWDSESRTQILPAPTGRQLAGDRVLGDGGLYDAVTGVLIVAFAPEEPMGMTPDGAFAFYRDAAGLHVVDASGASVLDWPGNYAASFVDIRSDELRIGNGDAGAGVVERVTFAGVQSLIPFTGTFHSWFRNADRFLSLSPGNVVRVYGVDGTQEHLWPLSTAQGLAGMGDHFWTLSGPGNLTVYQVGVANSGVTTFEGPLSLTQTGLASIGSAGNFRILVPGVGETSFSTGITSQNLSSVGVDANGNWVVGSSFGVTVRHGTPTDGSAEGYLGCGAVTGIAGTLSGRVAVATKTNQLLIYSLSPAGDKTLEKVIPIDLTDDMEMTEDGALLMAHTGNSATNEILLDLISETATGLGDLPEDQNGMSFDFSDSGDMLGSLLGVGTPANPTAYWSTGGTVWTPPCVSPTGNGDFTAPTGALPSCVTTFFDGGSPVNTVGKCAMGWLGPDRVLTQSFTAQGASWIGSAGEIYDATGNFVAATPIVFNVGTATGGPYCPLEPAAGTNLAFIRHQRRLVDYATGTVVWQPPTLTESADRVGSFVAWEDGARVRLVPY